ncbi:hypothetical protein EYF80_056810 [Liparis tanakae]|uniref:Uncharacterized protein n=1 Tax=Liparis tanakae TaxID=230148 RepID=A0A4Z2EVX2_9TELE|nr:hypothetical protein EYF80_056810 [Liparis tanakae]
MLSSEESSQDFVNKLPLTSRDSRRNKYLKPPEASDVPAALEAGGLQTLVQTGLDADQTRDPGSDHGHLLSHHAAGERASGGRSGTGGGKERERERLASLNFESSVFDPSPPSFSPPSISPPLPLGEVPQEDLALVQNPSRTLQHRGQVIFRQNDGYRHRSRGHEQPWGEEDRGSVLRFRHLPGPEGLSHPVPLGEDGLTGSGPFSRPRETILIRRAGTKEDLDPEHGISQQ